MCDGKFYKVVCYEFSAIVPKILFFVRERSGYVTE